MDVEGEGGAGEEHAARGDRRLLELGRAEGGVVVCEPEALGERLAGDDGHEFVVVVAVAVARCSVGLLRPVLADGRPHAPQQRRRGGRHVGVQGVREGARGFVEAKRGDDPAGAHQLIAHRRRRAPRRRLRRPQPRVDGGEAVRRGRAGAGGCGGEICRRAPAVILRAHPRKWHARVAARHGAHRRAVEKARGGVQRRSRAAVSARLARAPKQAVDAASLHHGVHAIGGAGRCGEVEE